MQKANRSKGRDAKARVLVRPTWEGGDFLDLYVANWGPNRLYVNQGDETFSEKAGSAGVADGSQGLSVAWGDYNNDGFLDLYLSRAPGNGSDSVNQLYRNNGNANSWLIVKLEGTESNRDAVGAKITVVADDIEYQREVRGAARVAARPTSPSSTPRLQKSPSTATTGWCWSVPNPTSNQVPR